MSGKLFPIKGIPAAILGAVLATAVRRALGPLLGESTPFILDYPAVMLVIGVAGPWPGALTTVLCTLGALLFIIPASSLQAHLPATGLFVGSCLALCGFNAQLRRAQGHAAAALQAGIRHEAALREVEALRASMLDTALDAIVGMDSEGIVREWNAAAERIFGRTREEAVGRELAEMIIPPAHREAHRRGLRRLAAEGGPSILDRPVKLSALRGDGTEFPVEVAVNRTQYGGKPLFVGFIRDETERSATEQALRASEARFQEFMLHTPALAWVRDSDFNLVWANKAYERFWSTTPEEMIGQPLEALIPPENAEQMRGVYRQALAADKPTQQEVIVPSREGKPHDWIFYLFPMRDSAGGQMLGGFSLDVTPQRNLERQLRQSQKMEAIGKLAGGVAHDFNNLLAIINGYTGLILEDSSLPARTRQQLGDVLNAGERAAGLTRQLLAFSRQSVLAPRLMDLGQVTAGVVKMLRRLIGEDIDLRVLGASEPAFIRADESQVEQVLMNLAVNARDAMPKGGTLTIELLRTELDETYTQSRFELAAGKYVVLTVSDTGCGMNPSTLERIFDPFFTTKELGQGTGLGLATVHGIIRQSGGDIHVYSEEGVGTTFKVYFPAAEKAAATGASETNGTQLRGNETILLVEDEPAVRDMIKAGLHQYGYEVLSASGEEEALQLARTHRGQIHLLLTDVVMPGANGHEVSVGVTAERPQIKVLFMSGYTDDAVVRNGVLHGESELILKPFTTAMLCGRLRQILSRS